MRRILLTFYLFCGIIYTIQNDYGGVDMYGAWFLVPLFALVLNKIGSRNIV